VETTDPVEIKKSMLEEMQDMSDEALATMEKMFSEGPDSNGQVPIAASAGSAGQPPVSPAPSLSSGESSAVEKAPVVASEGE